MDKINQFKIFSKKFESILVAKAFEIYWNKYILKLTYKYSWSLFFKKNVLIKYLIFRFETVAKLGQGTYGKVQLGINKETGQEVRF